MRCHEALRAQGMRPHLWKWPRAERELFRMAGNAMNLNVVARVICALYPKKAKPDNQLIPRQHPKSSIQRNVKRFSNFADYKRRPHTNGMLIPNKSLPTKGPKHVFSLEDIASRYGLNGNQEQEDRQNHPNTHKHLQYYHTSEARGVRHHDTPHKLPKEPNKKAKKGSAKRPRAEEKAKAVPKAKRRRTQRHKETRSVDIRTFCQHDPNPTVSPPSDVQVNSSSSSSSSCPPHTSVCTGSNVSIVHPKQNRCRNTNTRPNITEALQGRSKRSKPNDPEPGEPDQDQHRGTLSALRQAQIARALQDALHQKLKDRGPDL